ncbi:protein ALTERED PHOSPHATE STARVATION RESPONSE 1-like [Pyrus x bretschneideri]|uniref:protein ALTERED PHOSPHATE STARVATION RESPONSE 1-like n=1 Tax=Pyrus x bretschneideri TaxID=225117 RepID=UPI000510C358|nr:protein ALTERED PHOSPHATE STARVATION RESPONSE 1-like [Pyrus x bretschneideri]XP_009379365.1 protein ALTERED PHOSPHATE STARVATION RESPONSE 1-like [Pyrus x bretschneideri]
MGCCYSRVEREEMVSRCKSRKRYMKQLVKARQAWSAAHTMYLRSLRCTGSALLQFSNAETTLHHHHHNYNHNHPHNYNHHHHDNYQSQQPPLQTPPTPQPPPPPPPLSSSSDSWTTSTTPSTARPPPPPPPPSSTWDFWDPFVASSSRPVTEEEWESTTTASEAVVTVTAASTAEPPSVVSGFSKESGTTTSELAMVVSRNAKDLVEIIKELDEYFLKAADAGGMLSSLLEVPRFSSSQTKGGKIYDHGCNLSQSLWTWGSSSQKFGGFGKMGCDEMVLNQVGGGVGDEGVANSSHCSTVERLYAWEKKLYQEVKDSETLKVEHEKRVSTLKKLEMKRGDYVKTEKTKKEVEKLESQMMVSSQTIETTSAEIINLRETELYPQLIELVKGLMCMWRSMYECHQVQKHIVQQLRYLNTIPSTEPTSEIHRQAALQLELQVQQWHLSFCSLVKAQRDYIQSLTGWLRLSLFQFRRHPIAKTSQESRIYTLCEEWHHAIDRIPDKVASEGIKSFLTVVHAIVVQQAEEYKQKRKSESTFKELEKKATVLRSLESRYGPYSMPDSSGNAKKNPVAEKRAKIEVLRAKAEEEKSKHEKLVNVTRTVTISNLQMGFPHVFEAMVGFSSVCMQAFEQLYNQSKSADQELDVKMLLP